MVLKRFSKRTLFVLLVCFVVVIGTVIAYVYLLNNQPSVELSRMDVSNGLILEIDKTVYERGENVTITFTNNRTKAVAFPDYRWFNIRDSDGRTVAPGGAIGAVLSVPAGDSLTVVWNQKNYVGDPLLMQVPPSIYTVDVTAYSADLTARIADLSVTFEIVG